MIYFQNSVISIYEYQCVPTHNSYEVILQKLDASKAVALHFFPLVLGFDCPLCDRDKKTIVTNVLADLSLLCAMTLDISDFSELK